MTLERAQDLRNSFNNGDFYDDIEPFFNDLITFFKFMKKYGLLGELDLGQVISTFVYPKDFWQNTLIYSPLFDNVKKEGIRL